MSFPELMPIISYALGAIIVITIAFVVVKSTTSKETNDLNEKNIRALQTQNGLQAGQLTVLDKNNKSLTEEVAKLTVKVETLSTIPVQKIEQHMKDTNEILRAVLPLLSQSSTTHTTTETVKTTG